MTLQQFVSAKVGKARTFVETSEQKALAQGKAGEIKRLERAAGRQLSAILKRAKKAANGRRAKISAACRDDVVGRIAPAKARIDGLRI